MKGFERLSFWPAFGTHALIGICGSFVVGFMPEAILGRAYYNTGLEPYSPMIVLVALLLGFALNADVGHTAAIWVWVIGFAWLAFGMNSDSRYWYNDPLAVSRSQYIRDNFFGPSLKCSGSECLGELIFTTPFAASVGYSIGAFMGYMKYRRRRNALLLS
jgi:hypothetical protein